MKYEDRCFSAATGAWSKSYSARRRPAASYNRSISRNSLPPVHSKSIEHSNHCDTTAFFTCVRPLRQTVNATTQTDEYRCHLDSDEEQVYSCKSCRQRATPKRRGTYTQAKTNFAMLSGNALFTFLVLAISLSVSSMIAAAGELRPDM